MAGAKLVLQEKLYVHQEDVGGNTIDDEPVLPNQVNKCKIFLQ